LYLKKTQRLKCYLSKTIACKEDPHWCRGCQLIWMLMRANQIAAELGRVHEILGQGAMSMGVLESDWSFIVIAVLGDAEGRAGGVVGYRV